jgi:uncharacterized protein
MELSKIERLILRNQYAIMEKVDPAEADSYKRAREILELGYTAEYSDIAEIVSDEMAEDACEEVREILDMHRVLNYSYEALEDKSGVDPHLISFWGFDGNNESRHMSYARFLKDHGSSENVGTGDLNSHMPTLDRYRVMLRRWKASKNRYDLTRDDVLRIAARVDWGAEQ